MPAPQKFLRKRWESPNRKLLKQFMAPALTAGLLSSKKRISPDRVSFPVRVVRALLTALTGRETLSGMRELNSPGR